MKKFLILLVLILIPYVFVYGQIGIGIDAVIASLLEVTHVDQGIAFAQMIADNIEMIENTVQQIEYMKTQADLALRNINSAGDIKDFEGFMDWYNRQLYLERKTGEAFDNINITIGKKQYHITDIEGMAYGYNDSYNDYWDKEFTDEQRKEMWLGLGLTPSNYAYVQPFRQKGREITQHYLVAAGIQNEEYMAQMQRNAERKKKMAADKNAPEEKKLTSKDLMLMMMDSLMETNKVMNDIAMNQALQMEKQANDEMLSKAPKNNPPISDWKKYAFEKIQ